MKRFLAVLMVVTILVSCTSPAMAQKSKKRTKGRTQPPKQEQSADWLKGGTLTDKKMSDWQKATKQNKIATCGGIVAAAASRGVLNIRVTTDTLKNYAEILAGTLDAFLVKIPNHRDVLSSSVMDAAVIGMAYLGWIK